MLKEATKDSKEFSAMEKHEQKDNTPDRAKSGHRETCINCKYGRKYIKHGDMQHMARDAQNVRKYAKVRAGRP